jgi:hypothetical protein
LLLKRVLIISLSMSPRYDEQELKKHELARKFSSGITPRQGLSEHVNTHEKTPLLGGGRQRGGDTFTPTPEVEVKQKKKKEPSLFRALTRVYGVTLLQAHACKIVCDLLTFVGPTLQK